MKIILPPSDKKTLMPAKIGPYKIIRKLDTSETASLYLAVKSQHCNENKLQKVVIKVFDQTIYGTCDQEIELLQNFDHKNVIEHVENGKIEIALDENV